MSAVQISEEFTLQYEFVTSHWHLLRKHSCLHPDPVSRVARLAFRGQISEFGPKQHLLAQKFLFCPLALIRLFSRKTGPLQKLDLTTLGHV